MRWSILVVAVGLALPGCGESSTGATETGSGNVADATGDEGLFPAGVDVAALDPMVRRLLAERLAEVERGDDPAAAARLADAWLAHDRSDLAIQPARAAVDAAADPASRLILLGDALAAVGDLEGAIEAGRRAVAESAGLSEADRAAIHWRVAGWALDLGELDEARTLATRSVALATGDRVPLRMLATVLLAEDRPAEALEALAPLAGDSRDGATQYLRSRALTRLGRDDEAGLAARLAGDARPVFVDPWLESVRATRVDLAGRLAAALDLASRGRREEALAVIAACRPHHPGRREIELTAMGVHALVGEHESVLEIGDGLIPSHPEWAPPRYRAGHAALAIARRTAPPESTMLDRATSEATVLVRLTPRDPQARELLGRTMAAAGRWPEALLEFEQALSLAPGEARYHVAVGECLVSTGRPLDAIRVVNEMDRLFGRSVDAALVRVRAMAATGRAREARVLLEQCRGAIPNHPGLVLAEEAVVEAGG